jgi:hypothetical protein
MFGKSVIVLRRRRRICHDEQGVGRATVHEQVEGPALPFFQNAFAVK